MNVTARSRVALGLTVLAALVVAWLLLDGPQDPPSPLPGNDGLDGTDPPPDGADGRPDPDGERPGGTPGSNPGTSPSAPARRPDEVWGRVLDPEGAGVPGARVSVHRGASRGSTGITDAPPLLEGRSGEEGAFRLGPLPAEALLLLARAEGLATAHGWIPRAGGEVVLRMGPAGDLTVRVVGADAQPTAGARVQYARDRFHDERVTDEQGEARFEGVFPGNLVVRVRGPEGRLAVQPVAVRAEESTEVTVALTAGNPVAGRVVRDDTGSAVEGAAVRLRYLAHPDLEPLEAETGGDGSFRIPGVAFTAGMLEAVASRAGFASARVQWRADGTPAPLELRLWAEGDISGLVVDERGHPVAGAEIWWPRDGLLETDPKAGTRSDAEGRFAIGLPIGPTRAGQHVVAAHGPNGGIGMATLDGASFRDAAVKIVLAPPGSVTGVVVDERGDPVPWALVTLEARAGGAAGLLGWAPWAVDEVVRSLVPTPLTVLTDTEGAFVFHDVPPGSFGLRAEQAERRAVAAEALRVAPAGRATVRLLLPDVSTIRGRVTDGAGLPVRGATVCAWPRDPAPGVVTPPCVVTGADGRFAIRGSLGEGAWRLVATSPPSSPGRFDEAYAGDADVEIRLISPARVSGQVRVDGRAYEKPFEVRLVAGRTVTREDLQRGGGTPSVAPRVAGGRFHTSDGTFDFPVSRSGSFFVVFFASDGSHASAPIAIEVDAEVGASGITVALVPAAALAGRVASQATAEPLVGALVALRPFDGDRIVGAPVAVVRTDASGQYKTPPLAAGPYHLTVVAAGMRPFGEVIDLLDQAPQRRDVALRPMR